MGWTYKSYEAPGTRPPPPIFHEVSATGNLEAFPIFRQKMEGQLSKWTNLMKGWQYRWFVLNSDSGHLEYYVV